jgi:hypothetical protein
MDITGAYETARSFLERFAIDDTEISEEKPAKDDERRARFFYLVSERQDSFLQAKSFEVWARERTVDIKGKKRPVTLKNLRHYFFRPNNSVLLSLFKKYTKFLFIEQRKHLISESSIIRRLKKFGANLSPGFREVTSWELAQIYSVKNEMECFYEQKDRRYFPQIRKQWENVIETWLRNDWIDERKKIKLFEKFEALFSPDSKQEPFSPTSVFSTTSSVSCSPGLS